LLCLYVFLFLKTMFFFFLFFFFLKKKKKKKKWGRRCRILFLLYSFSEYVFLPDISVHCALIEYAYI